MTVENEFPHDGPISRARVKYEDYKGSASADSNDSRSFKSLLIREGIITEQDYIAAIRLGMGEIFDTVRDPYVEVYVREDSSDEKSYRCIVLNMTMNEFLLMFKRFQVLLTK
ncbi:MAG: hypothetical protein F4113_08635 [Rhodothermaceae bacterium]|nr:hypothetical protein [Rhodothermaceae bacterium]